MPKCNHSLNYEWKLKFEDNLDTFDTKNGELNTAWEIGRIIIMKLTIQVYHNDMEIDFIRVYQIVPKEK